MPGNYLSSIWHTRPVAFQPLFAMTHCSQRASGLLISCLHLTFFSFIGSSSTTIFTISGSFVTLKAALSPFSSSMYFPVRVNYRNFFSVFSPVFYFVLEWFGGPISHMPIRATAERSECPPISVEIFKVILNRPRFACLIMPVLKRLLLRLQMIRRSSHLFSTSPALMLSLAVR